MWYVSTSWFPHSKARTDCSAIPSKNFLSVVLLEVFNKMLLKSPCCPTKNPLYRNHWSIGMSVRADERLAATNLAAVCRDDTQISRDPVSAFHLHQISDHHVLGVDVLLLTVTDDQSLLPNQRRKISHYIFALKLTFQGVLLFLSRFCFCGLRRAIYNLLSDIVPRVDSNVLLC